VSLPIRAAGDTHIGHVRTTNEDSVIVDARRGLYAVLDGMGGANAGDIASQTARDVIVEFVKNNRRSANGRVLLDAAFQTASKAVNDAARQRHDRHGMGTTVVACLIESETRALIAHVGDSRAYLLRNGRLIQMTKDHTIVAELVERGALSAEEAEQHAYKNVLSRNLGARAEARVDFTDVELKVGDRILLCSDGLYGFASVEAIQYLLGSGDAPEHVARDLIELALRGGGGDNVSAIVVEAGQAAPTTTQLVRSNGSIAWWQRRQRFLSAAQERGIARSPIAASLGSTGEPVLELLAGSLCQAVFHDLEKSTGVNVWTFAHNLAIGWLGRGGAWAPLRNLLDGLTASARVVIEELRGTDPQLGQLLDTAVTRALVVAELAVGSVLADQLRAVDSEMVEIHARRQAEVERRSSTGATFVDHPTIPFVSPHRAMSHDDRSPEIMGAVRGAVRGARQAASGLANRETVMACLAAIESVAADESGTAVAVIGARDLWGVRTVDEAGIGPLFDALERARVLVTTAVHQLTASPAALSATLRRLCVAHQRVVGAIAGLTIEAAAPAKDKLREAQSNTTDLRKQVTRWERRMADLERKFATVVDPSQPWRKLTETMP
jgi:serine/threonine protein phosphatase PrpC